MAIRVLGKVEMASIVARLMASGEPVKEREPPPPMHFPAPREAFREPAKPTFTGNGRGECERRLRQIAKGQIKIG